MRDKDLPAATSTVISGTSAPTIRGGDRSDLPGPSPVTAYAAALVAVALAVAVRVLLEPLLEDRHHFILPFAAVVFAAWYGGRGPGWVALLAGALSTVFLVMEPRHGLMLTKSIYLIGLTMYGVIGVAIIFVIDSLRQAGRRATEKLAQLRASEAFNRAVLESSPDCLKVLDTAGRLLMMNESGRSMMQIDDMVPLVGSYWSQLWLEPGRALVNDALVRARRGERVRFEGFCATAKGTPKWWDVVVAPAWGASGIVDKIVATSRDITEGKHAEQELRRLAAELSQADRRKDEFLATLAHELRNPLAPVTNCLQLMKRADGDPALIEQARHTMERQVAQMVRLIDDLLDVSRITRDRLELKRQQVSLAAIVRHAVEACRPFADAAGHKLDVALPGQAILLNADPVRLAQVLGNLLTNACKYTPPGGQIWLTVQLHAEEVAVSVKDTGVGIPPDMLPDVFELFTQVNRSLERSQGGLGIGLSLVKRLVELHGGKVSGHSEGLGRGSEFIVRLPVVSEPSGAAQSPDIADQPAPTARRRILIVDDNRDNAQSLAMLLDIAGNDTQIAYDGDLAIEMAAAYRPDAMLLDIGLPTKNGYQVCEFIRGQPWGKDIVMVAMTGWGRESDRENSKRAGFDEHLVKPLDHAVLMKSLTCLSAVKKD